MPETAGGAALLADPHDPASIAAASSRPAAMSASCCASSGWRGPASSPGRSPRSGRSRSTGRSPRAEEEPTVRVLVTGGAGFIGSHTCDRLVELGHEVIVLDALTSPVHRDGQPQYLTPGAELWSATCATATWWPTCCAASTRSTTWLPTRTTCTDFSRFTRSTWPRPPCSTRSSWPRASTSQRVVVASSQAAMGEGLYRCPRDGEQVPDMRPESDLARGPLGGPLPGLRRPLEMLPTPERVSNPQNAYGMSKYGEEMVAVNLGRRYGIPTVALRYSIVQGPRQSVYNAYSGACRIFCLHYLLGGAPILYEDGQAIRDYVNIHDVVDANLLALTDERAVGRVFNVGGGTGYTTARVRRGRAARTTARTGRRAVSGEYRFGDTRHIVSDISALQHAGLGAAADSRGLGGGVRDWLEGMPGLDEVLAEADAKMRALGVVRQGGAREGVPPGGRPRHAAAAAHRPLPSAWCSRRAAPARHLARRLRGRGGGRGPRQPAPPARAGARAPRRSRGPAHRAHRLRGGAAGQRGHPAGQPGLRRGRGHVPGRQRRQPDRLRPAAARRGAPCGRRGRDHHGLPHAAAERLRGRGGGR